MTKEKKAFLVSRREVWIQGVWIEAENKEEAVRLVAEGEGENAEESFEYSHTLEPDTWTVK